MPTPVLVHAIKAGVVSEMSVHFRGNKISVSRVTGVTLI